jgi:hypothetical protein
MDAFPANKPDRFYNFPRLNGIVIHPLSMSLKSLIITNIPGIKLNTNAGDGAPNVMTCNVYNDGLKLITYASESTNIQESLVLTIGRSEVPGMYAAYYQSISDNYRSTFSNLDKIEHLILDVNNRVIPASFFSATTQTIITYKVKWI